ncbi:MAG TPA: hypothetical protein VD816_14510 [Ohtaekwangia sp.]|nr:hypothetical protein [Ohtaekwangia sp.]
MNDADCGTPQSFSNKAKDAGKTQPKVSLFIDFQTKPSNKPVTKMAFAEPMPHKFQVFSYFNLTGGEGLAVKTTSPTNAF